MAVALELTARLYACDLITRVVRWHCPPLRAARAITVLCDGNGERGGAAALGRLQLRIFGFNVTLS